MYYGGGLLRAILIVTRTMFVAHKSRYGAQGLESRASCEAANRASHHSISGA
jgi:hypothetical protein